MLASISGDVTIHNKTICLWEVKSGKLVATFDGHERSYLGDVSFSPDGSMIITSGGIYNDGTIHIYNAETGRLISILEGEGKGITGAAFNQKGTLIASGGEDGLIELWGIYK